MDKEAAEVAAEINKKIVIGKGNWTAINEKCSRFL